MGEPDEADELFRLRTVLDGVEALIARERRARRRH